MHEKNAIVKVYDDTWKSLAESTLKFFTDTTEIGNTGKPLLTLLNECGAAAMPDYCVETPELCMFQAKCAQVPASLTEAFPSETCWYVVLVSSGEKTLEWCFQSASKAVEKDQFICCCRKQVIYRNASTKNN